MAAPEKPHAGAHRRSFLISKVCLPDAAKIAGKRLLSTLQFAIEFSKEYRASAAIFPALGRKGITLLKRIRPEIKGVGYSTTGKPEGELMKKLVWLVALTLDVDVLGVGRSDVWAFGCSDVWAFWMF